MIGSERAATDHSPGPHVVDHVGVAGVGPAPPLALVPHTRPVLHEEEVLVLARSQYRHTGERHLEYKCEYISVLFTESALRPIQS